jgi:hypothetical protein
LDLLSLLGGERRLVDVVSELIDNLEEEIVHWTQSRGSKLRRLLLRELHASLSFLFNNSAISLLLLLVNSEATRSQNLESDDSISRRPSLRSQLRESRLAAERHHHMVQGKAPAEAGEGE